MLTKATKEKTPLSTGNERVLVIDHEESLANMAKQCVERLGYQVTAKTISKDALDIFRSQPDLFDIVISDQTMPELTGEKLAKKLWKPNQTSRLFFVQDIVPKLMLKQRVFLGYTPLF